MQTLPEEYNVLTESYQCFVSLWWGEGQQSLVNQNSFLARGM